MSQSLRSSLRYLLPPIAFDLARALLRVFWRRRLEWEHVPRGFARPAGGTGDGWSDASIARVGAAGWEAFERSLEPPQPFGAASDGLVTGVSTVSHNTVMSYAYAVALAGFGRSRLSLLDWGGGLGHYGRLTRRLFPRLELDYHCVDVEPLASRGRELQPGAHFYSDDSWKSGRYDFVLASCSLHYVERWSETLAELAAVTDGHLFVTRLPTVLTAASFVQVQRPYRYGYQTEYPGWCLNRGEFLDRAAALGLVLVREFVTGERPPIFGAPEPCEYRGFLLRPGTSD